MNKAMFFLMILLALLDGAAPFIFYFLEIPFGITSMKDPETLANNCWQMAFHVHIIFASIALIVGWLQFVDKIRRKYLNLHRANGFVYAIASIIAANSALFISFYANGGDIAFMGFVLLSLIWFCTTILGFWSAKDGDILVHKKMMIYSYAACFSGVTLRVWLPMLSLLFEDFNTAYAIASWLCWLPNIIIASRIIKKIK